MPYAGLWRRSVAYLLDLSLLAFLYVLMFGVEFELHLQVHAQAGGVYGLIIAWLYFAGLESSTEQATLGKMLVGLRVTDLAGRRISFGRATARHFSKILSALILYIGFIMIALTERKQGLHDKLAGTMVLKGRPDPAPVPAAAPHRRPQASR